LRPLAFMSILGSFRCLAWFSMVLLCVSVSHGAEPDITQLKFERLTSRNGLNQNSVTRLFKDSAGMLWVGTQDGLHGYNGNDFKIFTHQAGRSDSLAENIITDITQDKSGYLWIATFSKGINRLDLTTGKFQSFGKEQGLTETRVTRLSIIGDSLWIGTQSGLFSMSLKTEQITQVPLGNSLTPQITSLANVDNNFLLIGTRANGTFSISSNSITRLNLPQDNQVRQIQPLSANRVLLAMGHSLWQYDLENLKGEIIWQRPDTKLPINDFIITENQDIWLIGPEAGTVRLRQQAGKWQAKHQLNDPLRGSSLSDNNQACLLYDQSGILWLGGSYSGISKINLRRQYFTHYLDTQSSKIKQANMIRGIFRSRDGTLWFGTEGDGLKSLAPGATRYDYHNELFTGALDDSANLPLLVTEMLQTPNEDIWFASNQGLGRLDADGNFKLYHLSRELREIIFSLTFDTEQRVWAATKKGLYLKQADEETFTLFEPLAERQIFAISPQEDFLWLGTLSGLLKLDPATGNLIRFHYDPKDSNSISNDQIRDILIARDGDVWIATHDGINRLQATDEGYKVQRLTQAQGIPGNTVYALLQDDDGNIWFSGNAGIGRLNPTSGAIITYNEAEGLQDLEFNGGVKWQDPDGELWFGGIRGANSFIPQKIPAKRPEAKLALTGYKIADQYTQVLDLSRPPTLVMDYQDQIISFEVASLDFGYPGLDQFAFYLEGFDSHWHEFKSSHETTYTNLAPGEYLLKVRHKLLNNPQGDQLLQVRLTVTAPFYLTPLAYAVYFFALLAMFGWFLYQRNKKHQLQKVFETSIQISEERLKLALWASGDGMWDWNIKENRIYRTNLSTPLPRTGSNATLIENIHLEDRARVKQALHEHLSGNTPFYEAEYRIEKSPGEWIWLLDRGKVVETDDKQQPVRMTGTHKNITERRLAENELRLSSQVLQSMNEAVVVGELNYRIISVNPAFTSITGFQGKEVLNKHFLFLALGMQKRQFYEDIEKQLLRYNHWSGELWIRTKHREKLLVWLEINQVLDNKGETSHFVAVFTDITDRKKAEEDLRVLASFDTLTGLPNRTLFQDRLNHALTQAHRSQQIVALLFLDLDRFKHINDSMGHHTGDLLLKAVASRLQNSVREGDTVARLGGDEFTIILEGVAKAKAATVISEKLIRAFQTPFMLDDKVLNISPSIGISLFPDDATDAESLIKYADTAMYHAKSLGRNNFQFYTESLNEYAMRHVQLEAGLKLAIARNEFSLMYQPKFRISDGKLMGAEALLRWHSAELGSISPAEFIPLAEEIGIINQIGHWVINQACSQMAHWIAHGFDGLNVAINLSARQLKADILSTIEVALAVTELPASALQLELTESMIMKNPEESIVVLSNLKALGLTLAVDDFGTGYSSLSYLKRLPIDILKIDREFVRDISTDPDDAAITNAIIALAHSLGLEVIAEGVETEEQLHYLANQECDEVQGFLLSKPLSAEDYLSFLQRYGQRTQGGQVLAPEIFNTSQTKDPGR
jgi:diguanylate cyclase (GGDEF)-like protein/PAS domain S-box-containing protein